MVAKTQEGSGVRGQGLEEDSSTYPLAAGTEQVERVLLDLVADLTFVCQEHARRIDRLESKAVAKAGRS